MNAVGRCSSSLLREWDQASASRRTQLLQWLLTRSRGARDSNAQEGDCGADVSLLLPRIIVWMDRAKEHLIRSPAGSSPLDEQLACIQLFLTSSNAHKYLHEFIQADGLRVLLHILSTDAPPHHHGVAARHRCTIYTVLSRLAQRGRAFKEQISSLYGELSMARGVIATIDHSEKPNLQSPVWTLCRMTLLEQIAGNRASVAVSLDALLFMLRHDVDPVRQFGAQILRELVSETSFFFDHHFRQATHHTLVPLSVELLHSTHIPLQHEGLELVHALLQMPSNRKPICSHLARWIHGAAVAADPVEPAFAAMQHTREYDMLVHMRSPFVHAAQALTTLMHCVPSIVPLLVETHEVLIPMAFVLTAERPQSLKWLAALTALHFTFGRCRQVAAMHLSQLFLVPVDQLLNLPSVLTPETFVDELLRDEATRELVRCHFFRNGWVRAIPPSSSLQNQEANDDDGDEDPSLAAIEYEIDVAVHRVIPGLPLHTKYESDDDDEEDDGEGGECVDFSTEKLLREKLERHFMKFRVFPKASPST